MIKVALHSIMEVGIGAFLARGETRTTDAEQQMPVGSKPHFLNVCWCLPTMVQNMSVNVYKYINICIYILLWDSILHFLTSVFSRDSQLNISIHFLYFFTSLLLSPLQVHGDTVVNSADP